MEIKYSRNNILKENYSLKEKGIQGYLHESEQSLLDDGFIYAGTTSSGAVYVKRIKHEPNPKFNSLAFNKIIICLIGHYLDEVIDVYSGRELDVLEITLGYKALLLQDEKT